MINLVNALIECIVTGLFVAIFVNLGIRFGMIPAFVIAVSEQELREEEDEQA
jgi:hypothetical protein